MAGNNDKAIDRVKRPAKKRGRLPGALIVGLVFVVLLAACAAVLFFNFFDSRQVTVAFMQRMDPNIQSVEDDLDNEWAELADQKTDLERWETELQKHEEDLSKREDALKKREDALIEAATSESSAQNQQAAYLARVFSSMDTAKVATTLQQMEDIQQVVRIMRHMSVDEIAALMAAFEDGYGAKVSAAMLAQGGR